jgi:CPA1 family monovalent cation:H+ antiporter
VIVFSLLLASAALPAVLRGLTMPDEPEATCSEDDARHAATQAAIAALEQAQKADAGAPDQQGQALAHVLRLYRHRLATADAAVGHGDAQALQRTERTYRLLALNAERDTVLRLARRMDISDDTARKLLRQIDLLEARYQQD